MIYNGFHIEVEKGDWGWCYTVFDSEGENVWSDESATQQAAIAAAQRIIDAFRCPECGSRNVIEATETDALICTDCGHAWSDEVET